MTKSVAVALVGGVLLLVGCGKIATQPPAEQATVTRSPEPTVAPGGGPQEQVPPPTEGAELGGASMQPVQMEAKGTTVVGSVETASEGTGHRVKTENIDRAAAPALVPKESDEANVPVLDRARDPNDAKPTRLDAVPPTVPASIASGPAESNDTGSTIFTEYAEMLKTHVHEDGRVDYGALRRRRLDLKPLLMKLGDLDPNAYQKWPREEKLAFWINAYNLKMLDIITRNYPIQSSWWLRLTWPPDDLRHIQGIWTDFKLVVMDEEFTLSEVERRLFRKTFDDPRAYLALTYASQSSPILCRQPYQGSDLDRQLDEQVRQFLSSPRGVQIDRRGLVVRLSALFKPTWRGKEFVRRYGTDKKFKTCDPETRAVLNFLSGYLPRDDVYFLEVENYTIEYMNFDWRLNDTSRGY